MMIGKAQVRSDSIPKEEMKTSDGSGKKGYVVLPPTMDKEIDDSEDGLAQEDLTYEIDPALIEGAGAESVSPGSVMKMDEEEREKWIGGIQEELKSLTDLGVYEEVTGQDCYERYWKKKTKTVRLPSKIVLAKKFEHDGSK